MSTTDKSTQLFDSSQDETEGVRILLLFVSPLDRLMCLKVTTLINLYHQCKLQRM